MAQYDGPSQGSDPWGQPGYDPYAEPGGYDEPRPPAPGRNSTALVVVLVSVLVLVLCGGGVAALYLIGAKDHPRAASGPGAPASRAATQAAASASAGASTTDPNSILKGQCVVNDGSADAPVLRAVGCGPNTFEVLARFDGTTDNAKCKTVPGSNFHYFYDTSPDTLDFVLCLKKL